MSRVIRGRLRPRLAAFRDRARGAFRAGDRGSSAVELVILAPTLIIVSLLIVQFAIWFDAQHAALAAAQEGDLVAREDAATSSGWQGVAMTAAENYYRGLGTGVLSDVVARTGTGAGETVSVTVSGNLAGVFPRTVTVTVSGPVECFRTQASGGTGCAP